MRPLLGIDFGTTHAGAALAVDGEFTMVVHADGGVTIPSVVAFPPAAAAGGAPVMGRDAVAVASRNPERTVMSVKRLLGRKISAPEVRHHRQASPYEVVGARNADVRVRVGRRHHAPQDLAAYIIGELRAAASLQIGEPVTEAVLAVPALFDDLQRQAIRDAARIAGLEVLGLVTASSAVALGSGILPEGRSDDQKVVVYDLGGGSFDVAALVMGDGRAEVVASGGDAFLGGEDFDQRLVTYICDEILGGDGGELRNNRSLLARLKVVAERAKHELSETEVVPLRFTPSASRPPIDIRLDRERLEALTQDLVDRTVWSTESVLREAKWTAGDIDVLIVTGGQSRMPRIREQVAELCGRSSIDVASPESLAALGAARQASALVGGVRGRSRARAVVTELTSLSLGIEAASGVFTRLVPKGTPMPIAQSVGFSTSVDGQTQIIVHLVQGEREMAADNESVARIHIGPLPARPRGQVQVETEIAIDGGGLPRVTARDPVGGDPRPVRVRPSGGLTETEVAALAAAHAGGPAPPAAALIADASVDEIAPGDAEAAQVDRRLQGG